MLINPSMLRAFVAYTALWVAQGGKVKSNRNENTLHKKVLTEAQAEAMGARALDGTPYAYYTSHSHAEGPHDWIIYLEGGGECETHHDCMQRTKADGQGSSKYLPATKDANGNTDVSDGMTDKRRHLNPDFYKFGTLFLPYLSGDDWIGTQRVACVPWGRLQNCTGFGEPATHPLFFAGHNNFEAAIVDWNSSLLARPKSVLLSGGSAGGQGAFFHADRLAELLPGTIVKANPQYGWFGAPTDTFPDWKHGRHTDPAIPYPSSGSPIAVPDWMYNISVFLPKNCLATLGPEDHSYLCTALPRVALTVRVPLFVSTNLFDGWLTGSMEMVPDGKLKMDPEKDPKLKYQLTVTAPSQRRTVHTAMNAGIPASRAAFVPECFEHPMEWHDGIQDYSGPVLGNCTHAAAVASWFFERGACERVLVGSENRPDILAKMGCNTGVFESSRTSTTLEATLQYI